MKNEEYSEQINCELLDHDIAEVKLDELKKVGDFYMHKECEDAKGEGSANIAKRFQVILQPLMKVFYSMHLGFVVV